MKFKKVMIVDDAEIDRYFAEKNMQKYNFAEEIITAESAIDALEYLSGHKETNEDLPNLIFLDINMPEMSGFGFLDEYAKLSSSIKKKCIIIMLSSSLHPEDRERAESSPYVCRFLSKPLTADKLNLVAETLNTI